MARFATALTALLLVLSGLLSPLQRGFAGCGDEGVPSVAEVRQAEATAVAAAPDDCRDCGTAPDCDCGDCAACHTAPAPALASGPGPSARADLGGDAPSLVASAYLNPVRSLPIEPPIRSA